MIKFFTTALSTDLAMEVANRISERKDLMSVGQILSRLFKFLFIGLAGLIVTVLMIGLARSGLIEQIHTQRLVTFVAIAGGLIFAYAIASSFVLMVDGLVVEYSRRVSAQQAESEMAEALHEAEATSDKALQEEQPAAAATPAKKIVGKVSEPAAKKSTPKHGDRVSVHMEPVSLTDTSQHYRLDIVSLSPETKERQDRLQAEQEEFKAKHELSPKHVYREQVDASQDDVLIPLGTHDASPEEIRSRINKFLQLLSTPSEVNVPFAVKKQVARELGKLFSHYSADRAAMGFLVNSMVDHYLSESDETEDTRIAH